MKDIKAEIYKKFIEIVDRNILPFAVILDIKTYVLFKLQETKKIKNLEDKKNNNFSFIKIHHNDTDFNLPIFVINAKQQQIIMCYDTQKMFRDIIKQNKKK